jgi:two-component system OmpR family response regulator
MNTSAFFIDSVLPLPEAFRLSALGERELHNGRTRASTRELEMLVRFDGVLTLEQVCGGMTGTVQELEEVFLTLERRGWLERLESDTFERQLQAQLDQLSVSERAAVDAGEVSLRRQGYFVEIARERTQTPQPSTGPLCAVIVEDEPILARFVKTYLQLEGIESRIAGDRATVMATFSRPPVPNVILLDVHLPDADGFQILARLRAHRIFRNVPVIMLTGEATRAAVIRGIAGGADGYVTKPFEAEALMRAVSTCLGLRRTADPQNPWTDAHTKALKWQLQPS